ncbi:LLM class flavin-dependent oxidoreductase [Catenulispora rubra]|uniref:LLM class flavin-dependent oxidoreductase n=1 Tax=Catenulispora rubra TaxID=280293 RepID=UPI00189232AE|nr:LLM class flavin-dependent oxidoreductase [Catenulispora rubra]
MPIEFIGIASTRPGSETETAAVSGPAVQLDYLKDLALAHEESGFDRVLVAHSSASVDGFTVADQILTHTTRLAVLLAHRPGFVSPTYAARKYATIDAFHPGRIALHTITGGDDREQARDGDLTDKATRYRRTDEFLSIVRKEWESADPFDFEGEFYTVRGGWSSVRPEPGAIPIYFGGASEDAIRVGGKHADVYAFWGEPLAGIAERIRDVRAAAAPYGRDPRFSVSLRPIPAATESEAWTRAAEILELTREKAGEARKAWGWGGDKKDFAAARGSQRLLEYAAQGDVHDKRLWTAIAKETGAAGNSTALVGSYEQVAESLLDYVALGVSTLLIRGFSPLDDARDYGNLVRLVREQADASELAAV